MLCITSGVKLNSDLLNSSKKTKDGGQHISQFHIHYLHIPNIGNVFTNSLIIHNKDISEFLQPNIRAVIQPNTEYAHITHT